MMSKLDGSYDINPENEVHLRSIFSNTEQYVALELALGDPRNGNNLVSFHKSLGYDEAEVFPKLSYDALDEFGLNAAFVPSEFGGALRDHQELVLCLRGVFRRDPSLGLGYGVTSFMAALPVWLAGTDALKHQIADVLLEGQPVAVAFHEMNHGNDILSSEFKGTPQKNGFTLCGEKYLINNIARAGGAVLFAKTDDGVAGKAFSLFYVERDTLNEFTPLPRIHSVGARTCELAGISTQGVKVAADSIIGGVGNGFELIAKAFQISRTVLPGMALGIADTAIRMCCDFADKRSLYGQTIINLPLVKHDLACVYQDYLRADVLCMTAARMIHTLPEQINFTSSVVKLFGPQALSGMMERLSIILGARHYLRNGEYAYFNKLVRDYPIAYLGHASSGVCLSLIIQQLRQIAIYAMQKGKMRYETATSTPGIPELLRSTFNFGKALPKSRP